MKVLGERVNDHLPEYSTLKSFGIFSPKRFEPECSSSLMEKERDQNATPTLVSSLEKRPFAYNETD